MTALYYHHEPAILKDVSDEMLLPCLQEHAALGAHCQMN